MCCDCHYRKNRHRVERDGMRRTGNDLPGFSLGVFSFCLPRRRCRRHGRYCKRDLHSFTITNQECRIYSREDGSRYLHFPKTKETLDVHIPEDAALKEVKVIPYYGDFLISVTFDNGKTVPERNAMFMAGIDLGVDNTAAIVINDGKKPVLYKGGALEAMNQFYNRNRAKYIGILMKGHNPKDVSLNTKMLASLSKNRAFFIRSAVILSGNV